MIVGGVGGANTLTPTVRFNASRQRWFLYETGQPAIQVNVIPKEEQ